MTLSERELAEVSAANDADRQPMVLVHGLWLLAGSWDAMRPRFEQAGYAIVAADWPGDPSSVATARANPEAFAGMSVGKVTEHVAELIGQLDREPILIGHSFGGLIVQKLAGMGLARATVAIDPASFRGVLASPLSSVRSIMPFLRNPANYRRSVTQTPAQFRYAMANTVSEAEAAELYESLTIPGAGRPLFQVAAANVNPKTECAVDTANAERGPLLIICGSQDHITPASIACGEFKRQRRNPATTEFVELDGCGHSLVFDSGSSQVADTALNFLERVETERANLPLMARNSVPTARPKTYARSTAHRDGHGVVSRDGSRSAGYRGRRCRRGAPALAAGEAQRAQSGVR